MNPDAFSTAWDGIEASWRSGRLAHAWILQGAPHGAALRFAEKMLNLIFNHHPQILSRTHPDILWIEPLSKSRQIVIDEVRELIEQLSKTSFSGGWKIGVILCADRMTDQAANALLKTLEEPPPNSLLLLITDEPHALLPTISSRCQKISLAAEDEEESRQWKRPLLDLLRDLPPTDFTASALLSMRMLALLDELKKEFETEEAERIPDDLTAKEAKSLLDARSTARLIEVRTEILRTLLRWQRDVLLTLLAQDPTLLYFQDDQESVARQAMLCTRADALKRIAAVEEAARLLDRNLPAGLVFNQLFTQFS